MPFLNDITLGQYYPGNSFLHRLDTRSKLYAGLLFMTGLLISYKISSLLMFAGLIVIGIYFSGIELINYLRNLKSFFWIFLITFLTHAFLTKGVVFLKIPILSIDVTVEGVVYGLSYSVRLAVLIFFTALLTFTTTPIELTDSLEKFLSPLKRLKVPVQEFVLMIALTLRFIPILISEAQRIRNAQLCRGMALQGSLKRKVQNIIPIILPLFVSAIRRAEDLAVAMEARNYQGAAGRTSYTLLVFSARDYGLVLLASFVFIISIFLRFL